MDIGTPVLHTDSDENTFAGLICGRDFQMRPVVRTKAGEIRRKPDGTLADVPAAPSDTVKTEKVDSGLFVVDGVYRDGSRRLLIVDPSELLEAPAFGAPPQFSHAVAVEAPPEREPERQPRPAFDPTRGASGVP